MDRPRRPLTAPGSSQLLFDYRYGWSFFAAGAAFIMAEFAALVRKLLFIIFSNLMLGYIEIIIGQ